MPLSTVATLPHPLQRPGIWGSGNRKHIAYCQPLLSSLNPLLSPLTPPSPDTGWILQRTKAMGLQTWEQQAQSNGQAEALEEWRSPLSPRDRSPLPSSLPQAHWPLVATPVGTLEHDFQEERPQRQSWPSPPAFGRSPAGQALHVPRAQDLFSNVSF